MNEDQLMEELYNKRLEAQEAEMEAKGLMDAPDSYQIAGWDTDTRMEQNELMGDALDSVRDEEEADLAAQEGEEVTLLSDKEIIDLLSTELEDWN
jgi:hypothetical protein